MRILITADLHYDIARSRRPAEELAQKVVRTGGDALVLVGDTAGAELGPFADALDLFAEFPGRRLLVPGNHGLWCRQGETSLERYEAVLPELAAEHGFSVLDHEPVAMGNTGLVGSVGWYDYSFRDTSLGLPVDFYRVKTAPGAVAYLKSHPELLKRHAEDLTEQHMRLGARWMDGVHVSLNMDDVEFVEMLTRKLRRQLGELAPRVDRIVAFMHHVPFVELMPSVRHPRFAFAQAFLGSPRFGKVLQECPKVTHVFCGHSHMAEAAELGHLRVENVGSTYVKKKLRIVDL
ncbi:MAG: metallophosphoesterase [Phycisphaerae bacterium]